MAAEWAEFESTDGDADMAAESGRAPREEGTLWMEERGMVDGSLTWWTSTGPVETAVMMMGSLGGMFGIGWVDSGRMGISINPKKNSGMRPVYCKRRVAVLWCQRITSCKSRSVPSASSRKMLHGISESRLFFEWFSKKKTSKIVFVSVL